MIAKEDEVVATTEEPSDSFVVPVKSRPIHVCHKIMLFDWSVHARQSRRSVSCVVRRDAFAPHSFIPNVPFGLHPPRHNILAQDSRDCDLQH
jgi:hypothetical protein